MGRNQEALRLLSAAHRLFSRLDARVDLVDVASKVRRLEDTYLAVVREWGQSIESADSYTFGHCERVATYAMAVAQQLGCDESQLTAIRLGAYLHDLGKVRVPHEILNKPAKLTEQEFDVIKQHPEWGIELLATIEFPWDIKPIIRWHHEKYDGSGYPDRLRGDEIPVAAQIVCIADVYDALTTTRSYRAAMSRADAIARMEQSKHWWRPDVVSIALHAIVGANTPRARPRPSIEPPHRGDIAGWIRHRPGVGPAGRPSPACRQRLPRVLASGAKLRERSAALPRFGAGCTAVQVSAIRGAGIHPSGTVFSSRCRRTRIAAQPRVVGPVCVPDLRHHFAYLPRSGAVPVSARAGPGAERPILSRQLPPRPDERHHLRAGVARAPGVPARSGRGVRRFHCRGDGDQDHSDLLRRLARDPWKAPCGRRRICLRFRLSGRSPGAARSSQRRRRAGRVLRRFPEGTPARRDRRVSGRAERRWPGEPDDPTRVRARIAVRSNTSR